MQAAGPPLLLYHGHPHSTQKKVAPNAAPMIAPIAMMILRRIAQPPMAKLWAVANQLPAMMLPIKD